MELELMGLTTSDVWKRHISFKCTWNTDQGNTHMDMKLADLGVYSKDLDLTDHIVFN